MTRFTLISLSLLCCLGAAVESPAWDGETPSERTLPGSNPTQRLEPTAAYAARINELLAFNVAPSAPTSAASDRTLVTTPVYGRFGYYRDDGVYVGARNAKVVILRQTYSALLPPSDPTEVLTVETDAEGYFTAYPLWDCYSGPLARAELVVRFESQGLDGKSAVTDATQVHSWSRNWYDAACNEAWDIGIIAPLDEADFSVLHVFNTGTYAWDVASHEWDVPFLNVSIAYPAWAGDHFESETVGFGERSTIFIPEEDGWHEDAVFHGYGHAVDEALSSVEDSDLCNGLCDPDGVCSYCDWCDENPTAAWNEGFAGFIADVLTRRLAAEPGAANVDLHDFELLQWCGSGGYDSHELSPGYTAALLRDMVDPVDPADDHARYPGYADDLQVDIADILDVLDWHTVSTTSQFLESFANAYPDLRASLWETAFNCGFDLDTGAPGVVTDLTSPSHTVGFGSTDRTVDFTWTTADDDMSGIEGYAVRISVVNGMPFCETTIGDVTSYTSAPLSTGTYYFSIRAKDRAGHCSPVYTYYGPFTVIDNETIDLVHVLRTNYDDLSFPSQGDDNSVSEAHVTPVLIGNTYGNHWNLGGTNQGAAATGVPFSAKAFIDDQLRSQGSWGSIAPGGAFFAADAGNFLVPGGRHSYHTKLDGNETVGETDEDNNIHGDQYVWTGLPLSPGVAVTRAAPAGYTDGWEHMSGLTWYNCDGLSFDSSGWWNAVTVRPQSDLDDLACRLHSASTGSTDGFSANQAYSSRPAGLLDGVIVNRNMVGDAAWDVGVVNIQGATADYRAEHQASTGLTFGDSVTVTMNAGQHLMLKEVYIGSGNLGDVHVGLRTSAGSETLTMSWLDRSFGTGTLIDSAHTAQSDADGAADLSLNIDTVGYYCLVVYRDSYTDLPLRDIALEVQAAPADLTPIVPSGWDGALVPLPTDSGTFSSVPAPSHLAGDQTATYLNHAIQNISPASAVGVRMQANLDGAFLYERTEAGLSPGQAVRFNAPDPVYVRGGRHTLNMVLDPFDSIEELDERNNTFGRQYVWAPVVIPTGGGVTRPAPPDPVGGWSIASALYFNCDGLRMASGSGYWQAAAVLPTVAADNIDVRLHPASTGPTDGFKNGVAWSNSAGGVMDFVVVNYNETGFLPYDIGVIAGFGSADNPYRLEIAEAAEMGPADAQTVGPMTMGPDEMVDLYEWEFTAGTHRISLHNDSGGVDWGLSLHRGTEAFHTRVSAEETEIAWLQPGGQGETIDFDVPGGYHCLAVWKVGAADLPLEGRYTLYINSDATGVEDGPLPSATRLIGAVPNPFNPSTAISYELEHESAVQLSIYDLTGALVRNLVREVRPRGRHTVEWSGLDSAGRRAASGTYVARLDVEGRPVGRAKLMLVK